MKTVKIEECINDRPFLQELRNGAERMAHTDNNPTWNRAYLNLADAADRLDAMQARCTATESGVPQSIQGEGRPLTIGTECGWAEDLENQQTS